MPCAHLPLNSPNFIFAIYIPVLCAFFYSCTLFCLIHVFFAMNKIGVEEWNVVKRYMIKMVITDGCWKTKFVQDDSQLLE